MLADVLSRSPAALAAADEIDVTAVVAATTTATTVAANGYDD